MIKQYLKKKRKSAPEFSVVEMAIHLRLYEELMSQKPRRNDNLVEELLGSDGILSFGLEPSSQHFQLLGQLFSGRQTAGYGMPQWSQGSEHIVVGLAQGRTAMLQKLLFLGADALCLEEGFVRSVVPEIFAQRDKTLIAYANPISYRLDSVGPHFWPKDNIGIRSFMSSHQFTESERNLGAEIRQLIVNEDISKYNFCQPKKVRTFPEVLVIDQAYNDLSVFLQGGEEGVFKTMLINAIEDNPGKTVGVKIHPEFKYRKTYLSQLTKEFSGKIAVYADDFDINALLASCETVYTYSSTTGLEGILRNKNVVTFGCPIYAGYGLSDDRRIGLSFQRNLSPDEMAFSLYAQNIVYVSPTTGKRTDPTDALQELVWLKKEYNK